MAAQLLCRASHSPVAAHVRYTDGLLTLDNISVTGPRGGQLTGEGIVERGWRGAIRPR